MRIVIGFLTVIVLFIVAIALLPKFLRFSARAFTRLVPKRKYRPPRHQMAEKKENYFGCEYGKYRQERDRIWTKARKLFKAKKFKELDQWAKEMWESRQRDPEGRLLLRALYNNVDDYYVGSINGEHPPLPPDVLSKLWLKEHPDSSFAHVVRIRQLVNRAWDARGDGYASTVTKEGWTVFEKHLREAKRIFEHGVKQGFKDPMFCHSFACIARGLSLPEEERMKWFKKSVELEPLYYTPYQSETGTRMPRWGGSAEDVANFAKVWSDKVGGDDGDIIYFWIVDNQRKYFQIGGIVSCKYIPLDMKRFERGCSALLKKHPCFENYSTVGLWAVWMQNKLLAKQCFEKLGNQYPYQIFGRNSKNIPTFIKWRKYALEDGPWPLHPKGNAKEKQG